MYEQLAYIALTEFGDVVIRAEMMGRRASVPLKLRLFVRDDTFIDVWLSHDLRRYAYHWEQRAKRGLFYRHDNAPDHPEISTHPKHFHNGGEDKIEESYISDDPPAALREFLKFARRILTEHEG